MIVVPARVLWGEGDVEACVNDTLSPLKCRCNVVQRYVSTLHHGTMDGWSRCSAPVIREGGEKYVVLRGGGTLVVEQISIVVFMKTGLSRHNHRAKLFDHS